MRLFCPIGAEVSVLPHIEHIRKSTATSTDCAWTHLQCNNETFVFCRFSCMQVSLLRHAVWLRRLELVVGGYYDYMADRGSKVCKVEDYSHKPIIRGMVCVRLICISAYKASCTLA
jgi:hypothetical protein